MKFYKKVSLVSFILIVLFILLPNIVKLTLASAQFKPISLKHPGQGHVSVFHRESSSLGGSFPSSFDPTRTVFLGWAETQSVHGLNQTLKPFAVNETLAVDDGVAENAVGAGGPWEFIFLNRFTPDESTFPFSLTQIQVYFMDSTGVEIGDQIDLVVYQDADGNPINGATFLYHALTTVQALDAWNIYDTGGIEPWVVSGPGDVLVGVIALETPGISYFPAAIDTSESQQRSWIGSWNASPPPYPPALPPDFDFGIIDNYNLPGNWLIRAVASKEQSNGGKIYLPLVMYRFPPIPDTPVLSPINNPNGDDSYTVNWGAAALADTYILEEDDDQGFSSPITRYSGVSTSWSATNKPTGTYYYRVKSHNSWGDSGWSNVQWTTVVPPPPPMTVVYVTNNTGCTVCLDISGTGIGEKCYANPGKQSYGTFPVGTYNYRANACCGSTSGSKEFSSSGWTFVFTCVSGDLPNGKTTRLSCELP